jgi:fumarylacetoacetase
MSSCIVNVPSGCDFTLENLPYGVFSLSEEDTRYIGVAIGEHILDLSKIQTLFNGPLMSEHQVHTVVVYGRRGL